MPAFEQAFAARVGARHASAVSSGTAALHLALRAVGVTDGDEVVTTRSRSSPAPTRSCSSARGRCSPTSTRDAQPRRRRCTGGGDRADHGVAAGRHLRLPGRHRGLSSRSACRSSRTPARPSAPATPTARRSARGRIRRRSPSTPTSRSPPVRADRRDRRSGGQGAHRLGAQPGPRPEHGLARPRPARLQLPPVGHRLRARARAARAARRDAGRRARAAAAYREALAGVEGPRPALRGPRRRAARVVRLRRPAPGGPRPRWGDPRAPRARGAVQALPAGHPPDELLPRALRHREGEFPVCEAVAARSVALPFFPGSPRGRSSRWRVPSGPFWGDNQAVRVGGRSCGSTRRGSCSPPRCRCCSGTAPSPGSPAAFASSSPT